jgi:cytochrome c peroxidase
MLFVVDICFFIRVRSDAEVNDIVAFLGSLTGSLPEGFERAPTLPAGGFGSSSSTPSASPSK